MQEFAETPATAGHLVSCGCGQDRLHSFTHILPGNLCCRGIFMRLSHVEAFSREQCWLEGTLLWPHSLCWGCSAEQTAFP